MELTTLALIIIVSAGLKIKHIRRIYRLFVILAKYGLADELASFGLGRPFRIFQLFFPKKQNVELKKFTRRERMRFAVEEMGTTAIKFARILSTRPDLLPKELIIEFEKLQSNVPPFPVEKAVAILKEQWGAPLKSLLTNLTPFRWQQPPSPRYIRPN